LFKKNLGVMPEETGIVQCPLLPPLLERIRDAVTMRYINLLFTYLLTYVVPCILRQCTQ